MQKRVHFMGIGGAGASAVAQISKSFGYQVSGCDKEQVKESGIPILTYHEGNHLDNIDILAVSPYYFFGDHEEVTIAKQKNILTTWQRFMAEYLHKDKFVIAIAGTHGKSTTTAMAGLLLEQALLDPTVELGATANAWGSNFRIGHSKYFVCEADEYNDNFGHYHPDILILNNIEMDHPEYFQNEKNLLAHYQRLVDRSKQVIYNKDSPLVHLLALPSNSVPYTLSEFPTDLKLSIPGAHNKSNALGIIKLAKLLNIDRKNTTQVLQTFSGLKRRIELLGEKNDIRVYDDYANHPTAFAASLAGVKELHPDAKILAIIEPHTYSRLRAVLSAMPDSVKLAEQVILTKIFASRETDPGDFTSADIAKILPNAVYIPEFSEVISYISLQKSLFDVILVMGSGDSSKLSKLILASL